MIQKIDHRSNSNAEKLKNVFQRSYKVEAQLLGAKNFPPLSRTLSSYKESNNDFFGFYDHDRLTAVIEMKNEEFSMHIQSLVVDPEYFRRGIARALIIFIIEKFDTRKFTVETGKNNSPARSLYEGFGFKLVKTYLAEENIEKVRYQKV